MARSCPCGLRVALRRRFGAAAAVVADDGFPRTEAPFAVFSRFFFLDREREREKEKWDSTSFVSFEVYNVHFLGCV